MRSWDLDTSLIRSNQFAENSLTIFDSKTNQPNAIKRSNRKVQIYVCGITPYDSAHLGHAFTYLTFDLMIRAMNFIGIDTHYVQNVTDIDDPLFERARSTSTKWQEIVDSQIEIYRQDMQVLNILPPNDFVSVQENIDAIREKIRETIQKDLTYQLGSEIYFKTSQRNESKLVDGFSSESLIAQANERGCDTDREGKANPIDPILWKASKIDEPSWIESFGPGRPGWHIQCVSIVDKFADLPLDIQGGGKDLLFPHHAMCDEQSRALGLGDLAHNYCHVGMVSYQGSKMSKSKGNLVFVHKLISEGVEPMVVRLALMTNHWQEDWEWDNSLLDETKKLLLTLNKKFYDKFVTDEDLKQIVEMCLDNLSIPHVLNFLINHDFQDDPSRKTSMREVLDSLLGIILEGGAN